MKFTILYNYNRKDWNYAEIQASNTSQADMMAKEIGSRHGHYSWVLKQGRKMFGSNPYWQKFRIS